MPASVKLLALALVGTFLFLTEDPRVIASAAILAAALLASLGRAAACARVPIASIAAAALLVVAFHAATGRPTVGMVSALRLLSAALMGISLTLTTRSDELLAVFERLLAPLERLGVHTASLALQLGLMLRFTEHFFVQWKRLDDAHRARTGKPGGVRILAPLSLQMLASARRIADALEARLGP